MFAAGINVSLVFAARNIFRTAVLKQSNKEKNDLFLPGRMAYVVDLEDEYVESDIPTTLIRSKADCPNLEVTIINKLPLAGVISIKI